MTRASVMADAALGIVGAREILGVVEQAMGEMVQGTQIAQAAHRGR